MRPEYVNGFVITHNDELHEVVITFSHQFPDRENAESEDIVKIVMNDIVAKELIEKLPIVFSGD